MSHRFAQNRTGRPSFAEMPAPRRGAKKALPASQPGVMTLRQDLCRAIGHFRYFDDGDKDGKERLPHVHLPSRRLTYHKGVKKANANHPAPPCWVPCYNPKRYETRHPCRNKVMNNVFLFTIIYTFQAYIRKTPHPSPHTQTSNLERTWCDVYVFDSMRCCDIVAVC